jgi:hypothetical protein
VTEVEKKHQQEETPRFEFKCSSCSMTEKIDYFGKSPPFTKNIEFSEDCYVMKDPFTPQPSRNGTKSYTEYFIVLGSECRICSLVVCKDCSIFYNNTFCLVCANSEISRFPLEIQSKIRKEILAIKNK